MLTVYAIQVFPFYIKYPFVQIRYIRSTHMNDKHISHEILLFCKRFIFLICTTKTKRKGPKFSIPSPKPQHRSQSFCIIPSKYRPLFFSCLDTMHCLNKVLYLSFFSFLFLIPSNSGPDQEQKEKYITKTQNRKKKKDTMIYKSTADSRGSFSALKKGQVSTVKKTKRKEGSS